MSRAQSLTSSQPAPSALAAGPTIRPFGLTPSMRVVRLAAGAALTSVFLAHLGLMTFVDPDLWHEMATAREFWARGAMPLEDVFAYTPTVFPVVHHEWGTGAVLYGVALAGGGPALMFVKYLLTFGTAGLCLATARRRGASWEVILSLAPLTFISGIIGFTTVRAQLFTLFFTALLLYDLSADEFDEQRTDGATKSSFAGRWWKWLPLYVAWLNLHAGFVVGAGLAALYACEACLRRRPIRRFVVLGLGAAALAAVNPYGLDYYHYLVHGLSMARPLITEWQPLWAAEPTMFQMFLASLLLVLLAAAKLGVRRMPGLLLVGVTGYLAARHTRHVSIYFVVWLSFVPGYVQQIRLGSAIVDAWHRRRLVLLTGSAIVGLGCFARAVECKPWQLKMPVTKADEQVGGPVYPVGAVEYLCAVGFSGNLFTPFVPGGYCLYQLQPAVKVSFDGRYEVAYPRGALEENVDFYAAKDGWRDMLDKYPTDVVLVPKSFAVYAALRAENRWSEVYADEVYALFARPGLLLPRVERPGAVAARSFP